MSANHMRGRGGLRQTGIRPKDLTEVIRLYEAGWSLARLSARLSGELATTGVRGVTSMKPGYSKAVLIVCTPSTTSVVPRTVNMIAKNTCTTTKNRP